MDRLLQCCSYHQFIESLHYNIQIVISKVCLPFTAVSNSIKLFSELMSFDSHPKAQRNFAFGPTRYWAQTRICRPTVYNQFIKQGNCNDRLSYICNFLKYCYILCSKNVIVSISFLMKKSFIKDSIWIPRWNRDNYLLKYRH